MMIPNADCGPGDAEVKYRLGQMLVEGRGIGQDVAPGAKAQRGRQTARLHALLAYVLGFLSPVPYMMLLLHAPPCRY